MIEFRPWPSIGRLYRNCIITEKIDGTNAAVGITEDGEVYAQSRKRIITPEDDNYGFARYVQEHADEFRTMLGEGLHFGEWYGKGINRGYGLDEKRFALFNVHRWNNQPLPERTELVPVLFERVYTDTCVQEALNLLRYTGSFAGIGADFKNPEGVVLFLSGSQSLHKILLEKDDISKWEAKQ